MKLDNQIGKKVLLVVEIAGDHKSHKTPTGDKINFFEFHCNKHNMKVSGNTCRNCDDNLTVQESNGVPKSYCMSNQVFNNAKIELKVC